MDRTQLRLECIRLAVSKTLNHEDIRGRAKDYYDFVMQPDENVGNTDPTSVDVTAGKNGSVPAQTGMKSAPGVTAKR